MIARENFGSNSRGLEAFLFSYAQVLYGAREGKGDAVESPDPRGVQSVGRVSELGGVALGSRAGECKSERESETPSQAREV